jgi:tRNA threonylcarbamoyladenosine biosynthesis protein TsaE
MPGCRRCSGWSCCRRASRCARTLGDVSRLSASPEDTERAGAALAAALAPGDVVLVSGEMGAGKTTFVRGAARALGVTEPVTSPTFVVGHLYEAGVAHLDLYRLGGLDDEDPGLLDPYFGPDLVTFIEWPERSGLEALLGERRIARRVALAHAGGDRRMLEATG